MDSVEQVLIDKQRDKLNANIVFVSAISDFNNRIALKIQAKVSHFEIWSKAQADILIESNLH